MHTRYAVTQLNPQLMTDLIAAIKEKVENGWSYRRISKCFACSVRLVKQLHKMN